MSTVNRVFLIGFLGADPELRYMQNGDPVANMSIATTERWKDKASGEQREETEWHRLVLYKRLAEIAGEYLKKGAHVCVQGRIRTRKWQDKEGVDRYTTEIIVSDLQMLSRAPEREEEPQPPVSVRIPTRREPPPKQQSARGRGDGGLGDMESDIPFLPRGFGGQWRVE